MTIPQVVPSCFQNSEKNVVVQKVLGNIAYRYCLLVCRWLLKLADTSLLRWSKYRIGGSWSAYGFTSFTPPYWRLIVGLRSGFIWCRFILPCFSSAYSRLSVGQDTTWKWLCSGMYRRWKTERNPQKTLEKKSKETEQDDPARASSKCLETQ